MNSYRTAPKLHHHRDLGFYISFGIRVYCGRKRLLYIPDVFCKRQKAKEFVRRCNIHQPEMVHLRDLIEDEM